MPRSGEQSPKPADLTPADSAWRPRSSRQALLLRSAVLRRLRDVFADTGFLEVETPVLSQDIVVDAWLDPFTLQDDTGAARYLQTSPEAAMKRLLAAGYGSIFQISRVFRQAECGQWHNPEFTMVEWYGVGMDFRQQLNFTERLVRAAASVSLPDSVPLATASTVQYFDRPFRCTTWDQAFERVCGQSVLECPVGELRVLADRFNVPLPESDQLSADEILNVLLASCVEPGLGASEPEFLIEYPASQAALAELSPTDPRVALRFELYAQGLELCNGYHELSDADELQRRDREQNLRRQGAGQRPLPGAPRLIEAMRSGIPKCTGVALGLDRLVALIGGYSSIQDVIPFPWDRA